MNRYRKNPLRPLTEQEWSGLERIVRAGSKRADIVALAKEVLAWHRAVAFERLPLRLERRSGEAVSHLVAWPLAR